MSSRFTVKWARSAQDDLNEILDYVAADSPANALKVLDRLEQRAQSLAHLPTRGRIVPELKRQGVTGFRELIEPPWRMVYVIKGKRSAVVSVLDSRRQLEDLLLDRFLRH